MTNDGVGGVEPDRTGGSGLTGLAERLAPWVGAHRRRRTGRRIRPLTVHVTDGPTQREEPVIRVLVAEDQNLIRGALVALLSLESDITVVAETARGDTILAEIDSTGPTSPSSTSTCRAWTVSSPRSS